MGRVFKPENVVSRRKMIEDAIKDLDPALREAYRNVLAEVGNEALMDDEYFNRILRKINELKKQST